MQVSDPSLRAPLGPKAGSLSGVSPSSARTVADRIALQSSPITTGAGEGVGEGDAGLVGCGEADAGAAGEEDAEPSGDRALPSHPASTPTSSRTAAVTTARGVFTSST